MTAYDSNGTGGGDWGNSATWNPVGVPGAGDQATVLAGDTVYIDGDRTIGDGTGTTTVFQLMIYGNLVWRNESGDATANWTLSIDGNMRIYNNGFWYIGTEDNSLFGSKSIGPIPATRTATVNFINDTHSRCSVWSWTNSYTEYAQEFWGAANYHQDPPPQISGQADSIASDRLSFVDANLANVANPTGVHWYFNGASSLRLEGTEADAAVFDPSLQNDDFTVCAVVDPDSLVLTHAGVVMSKLTVTAGNHRCWYMHQADDAFNVAVSQNGDSGTTTNLLSPPCLELGKKSFVSLRYEYSGTPGASSWLEAGCNGLVSTNSSAYGPIHSSTNADVQIGDYDASGSRHFEGKIYWIAYWNRKLTDDEMKSLQDGLYPGDLSPDAYIDFNKVVGSTYDLEIPTGSPIQFDVEGTPVRSGSSDPVDWIGAWLEITGGTNEEEKREVTGFNKTTGEVQWSSDQPVQYKCDSSTVYTLRHNYSRAMLTADAGAGTSEIYLDRDVNWEVDDDIAVAVGYDYVQATERPERAVILSKTSARQYTISGTFTYNHVTGDMVIHFTKNVKINATNIVSSNAGYSMFYGDGGTRCSVKWNWVFFENCCTATNTMHFYTKLATAAFPYVRHCAMAGWLLGTTTIPTQFLFRMYDYNTRTIPEEYMLDDVQVFNINYCFGFSMQVDSGTTIEELERMKFRDCSFIGCNGVNGAMFYTAFDEGAVLPHYYNMWMTGRSIKSNTDRNGYFMQNGIVGNIDGFRVYQTTVGIGGSNYDQDTANATGLQIRNGYFKGVNSQTMPLYLFPYPIILIENTVTLGNITNAYDGFHVQQANVITFILINNKFDGVDSGSTIRPYECQIYEFESKYGLRIQNEINMEREGIAARLGSLNWIAHACEFAEPSITPPWNELDPPLNKMVSGYNIQGSYLMKIALSGGLAGTELHKPVLASVEQQSMGLMHAGSLAEYEAHPTEPRANTNIRMKITSYPWLGGSHFNLRTPLLAYVESGKSALISVWVRKNVTQEEGRRPKLHIHGNGFLREIEMSDAIDTWEQLSFSYTALYSGTVRVWFSVYNTLKYPKDSTDGAAEYGESSDYGTTIVYIDELEIQVTG